VGDDTALLLEARSGSEEALNQLFMRVSPRLLTLIRLRLGRTLRSQLESRDILQATLMNAFEGVDQLQAPDTRSLMAWLARIADNVIRDHADYHRRQRRDAALRVPLTGAAGDLADQVRSLSSRVALDVEMERVEAALEEMEPDHREVILLRHFEELPFRDIGERMGRSSDACRMLLARAMTALTLRLRGAP